MARDHWQTFLLAVQFLTRLPVPRDLPFSEDRMIAAVGWYPAVGALVGALGALVLLAAQAVWPMPVAVLASLGATLLATGAFHEDGLADAADGLGGGYTRDRVLEIMRDSRIGTYAAVTLLVVLGLKVAALAALSPAVAAVVLVVAHAVSRAAAVVTIATTPYAREEGAKFAAPTVTRAGLRLALGTAAVALLLLAAVAPGATVAGLAVSALLALGYRRMLLRRIDGYTGDGLGGIQQMAELGIYLGVLAWL